MSASTDHRDSLAWASFMGAALSRKSDRAHLTLTDVEPDVKMCAAVADAALTEMRIRFFREEEVDADHKAAAV
jgi:hypothetical protein